MELPDYMYYVDNYTGIYEEVYVIGLVDDPFEFTNDTINYYI
jgi:hypothetical protein